MDPSPNPNPSTTGSHQASHSMTSNKRAATSTPDSSESLASPSDSGRETVHTCPMNSGCDTTGVRVDHSELSSRFPYHELSVYGRRKKSLGQGVFSTVYLYKKGSTKYALKRIRFDEDNGGEPIEGREIPQFFLREVTAMVWLQHPNVIRLLDIVLDKNNCYLVMPLAQGTLLDLIRQKPSTRARQNYAYQVARGLAYCVANGVWNRDLKPANVLYFQEEKGHLRLALTDFGLAKTNMSGITPEYFTDEVYSLWYRAPEILMDLEYDDKAEVWAFGCVLAELYLGHPLCHASTRMGQLLELFQMFGTPTPTTWPDLPDVETWDMPRYTANPNLWVTHNMDPLVLDLLQWTLVLNPQQRLSIQQVLTHPYFSRVGRKIEQRFPVAAPDIRPAIPAPIALDTITNLKKETFFGHLAELLVRAQPGTPFYQSYRVFFLTLTLFNAVAADLGVNETTLELVGLACFDLAQKFIITEWIYFDDLTRVVMTNYQKDEIIAMQLNILKRRSWDLNLLTPFDIVKLTVPDFTIRPFIIGLLFYGSCTQLFAEPDPTIVVRECLRLAHAYHSKTSLPSLPSWLSQAQNPIFTELFNDVAKSSLSQFRSSLIGSSPSDIESDPITSPQSVQLTPPTPPTPPTQSATSTDLSVGPTPPQQNNTDTSLPESSS
jgi:serine/threonine protein kinase